jgi:anti-sigma factor RsiW
MAESQPLNDDERAELIAYLDGELARTEAQSVEKRLHADPRYRAEADALRRTWNLLDFLPKPEPSANFTNRTVDRIGAMRPAAGTSTGGPARRWLLGLGWAAAVLLAVFVGYGATGRLVPGLPPAGRDLTPEAEQQLVRDLRLMEMMSLYQYVDDIPFLNELDRPELFGDDHGS